MFHIHLNIFSNHYLNSHNIFGLTCFFLHFPLLSLASVINLSNAILRSCNFLDFASTWCFWEEKPIFSLTNCINFWKLSAVYQESGWLGNLNAGPSVPRYSQSGFWPWRHLCVTTSLMFSIWISNRHRSTWINTLNYLSNLTNFTIFFFSKGVKPVRTEMQLAIIESSQSTTSGWKADPPW